jgi:hypothetical protein
VASDLSRKRVHGQSAAVTAQIESAETMKQLSNSVEEISKTLATSGITTNNDIFQHAIMILNTHWSDFSSVNDFLDLGKFLTTPGNKHDAILFSGVESPDNHKILLERYLEDIKRSRAT